ncbi:MAG: nucleotide exchange factor GrpE [Bacteroidaceae bacterium]|jgi:molecular chaperone GrpE|nr:nucleotide exchange factor GrpE [Bacteroidaceae bacterium]SDF20418.1 molecular chaperone GrpE [Bacteroidales bacterium KHT7]MBP5220492.1 nucleotide exchange factor GrpE [Bacteroidaceae bacterium]MBQ1677680.1 nucleotide exchange factor GrpE [Bacteroidaceae bacterium]MBQ3873979.1 nucleotide exchange factor GrpE [Bacteroidaceae bacterium]
MESNENVKVEEEVKDTPLTEETNNEVNNPESAAEEQTEEKVLTEEEKLQAELAAAKAEIDELKNQMLYKQAEFENFRKRTLKEKAELIDTAGGRVLKNFLPVMDDMERAMANMEKAEDVAAVKEGVALIIDKFVKALASEGVAKMDVVGKDFDADLHEAVAMVPGMGEDNKNKVIDCVQTGYMIKDKVLRHAKVAVGQ